MRLATLRTDELGSNREAALRAMLSDAWADKHDVFSDTDWVSATGGTHLVLEDDDGTIVSHASIVDRVLETGGRSLATGYVEAVATAPGVPAAGPREHGDAGGGGGRSTLGTSWARSTPGTSTSTRGSIGSRGKGRRWCAPGGA